MDWVIAWFPGTLRLKDEGSRTKKKMLNFPAKFQWRAFRDRGVEFVEWNDSTMTLVPPVLRTGLAPAELEVENRALKPSASLMHSLSKIPDGAKERVIDISPDERISGQKSSIATAHAGIPSQHFMDG